MIAMLMRDQNGIEAFDSLADRRQSPGDLPPAEAHIHKYARALCGDKGGVAGAAAR
jgi:hypothetical protein